MTSWTIAADTETTKDKLVVPALLAVLVQWGLVRRRWLRTAGQLDLTRWPWFATGAAALTVLSLIGLAFLGSTLKHAARDFMWPFAATVT